MVSSSRQSPLSTSSPLPYKGGRFSLLCCGISVLPSPNISTSCTEIRIKPKVIPTGTSAPEAEYQVIYELHLRGFSSRSSNIFDFIRRPELGQEIKINPKPHDRCANLKEFPV
jgi:hypothetical protein